MKRIRIKINRLGRIRNSEVSFSQMVIFSGESGLGKSYLALLCHYFFEVLINTKRFENFFKTNNIIYDRTVLRNQGIATTIYKKDLEVWLAEDALAYIGYMLNHNVDGDIEVKLPEAFPEMIEIKFEEQMMGLVDNEDTYIVLKTEHLTYKIKDNTSFEELPYAFLLRHELINILFGNFKALKNTFVLPPSRGPLLTENIIPVTGLYKEYKNALDELNSANNIQEESDDYLLLLINDILEGNVTVNDNKYIYYMNDGGPLPISAAAASVKEIVPLELIAEKTNVANDAILIEEPEAHLHPQKQRMAADIIAAFFNAGAHLQITTHSDYFIGRINELMMLGRVKNRVEKDRFEDICKKTGIYEGLALNRENISAYLLKRNDDGNSVIDRLSMVDGIPFASFTDTIRKSMQINNFLEDIINDDN